MTEPLARRTWEQRRARFSGELYEAAAKALGTSEPRICSGCGADAIVLFMPGGSSWIGDPTFRCGRIPITMC